MLKHRLFSSIFLLTFISAGFAPSASAQAPGHRNSVDGYIFFGRLSSTPNTNSLGAGGELFIYKGLAAGGDAGTTFGNSDAKMTIASAGVSYHFSCCRKQRKVEPFLGLGFSYLSGNVSSSGVSYQNNLGQQRGGVDFSQGLIVWPAKHLGVRLEIREYKFSVSNGPLENVIPGGGFVEFRIGAAFR